MYGGAGLAIADFDSNGWYDIFLPNADGDQLYMGRSGVIFEDQSAARLPPESDVGVGATPVDADGDGDLDLFVAVALGPNGCSSTMEAAISLPQTARGWPRKAACPTAAHGRH